MAVLTKGRLSKMMLEKLLDFPLGAKNLKENVTLRLGMVGQLSSSREINGSLVFPVICNFLKNYAKTEYPSRSR
jgi:hypothetical protein